MAYIVKDASVARSHLTSPVARADWEQQIDLCKMAQRGWGNSRMLWNEFARQQPRDAALVARLVASDHQETAKANRAVEKAIFRDALLTKQYKPPKPKKPKKAAKKAARRAEVAFLTKMAGSPVPVHTAEDAAKAMVRADLWRNPDPHERWVALDAIVRGLV